MKSKFLMVLFAVGALAIVEFAVLNRVDIHVASVHPVAATIQPTLATTSRAPIPTYSVAKLIQPPHKYLGVTVLGGGNVRRVNAFGSQIDKTPNLVATFESFGDSFAASQVRDVYNNGGLAMVRWEPDGVALADIAAGKQDGYITAFAKAVRTLNLPIALSFAHEMNGDWYTWGTKQTTAAQYVAAWRHLHDLFAAQHATNVIWTWVPNVVNYLRSVNLAALYPGDSYVDWVGMDGYYTANSPHTFATLFNPTISAIRGFTHRPLLIVETGVQPGANRAGQISDLLNSVLSSKLIGLIYFNMAGRFQWMLDSDPASLNSFAGKARDPRFGFDVRTLK